MYVEQGMVHYTSYALTAFDRCRYRSLRDIDRLIGLATPAAATPPDPIRDRVAELSESQERGLLADYRVRYGRYDAERGGGVADISSAPPADRAAWTTALLTGAAPAPRVIYAPALRSGQISAQRDFLVRLGDGWQISLSRLARRVKSGTVLAVGVTAVLLRRLGVPVMPDALVLLGDGSEVALPVGEAEERAGVLAVEFEQATADHLAGGQPVHWADEVGACGWCADCREAAALARDVRTVAGVRMEHRALLRDAGVVTIDDLAINQTPVEGLDPAQLTRFRAQARLQLIANPPGSQTDPSLRGPLVHELIDAAPVLALPPADPGDIFFDFESDPMWTEDGADLGLDYLFGMWLPSEEPAYAAFWAHDREQEREALLNFLAFVRERRAQHPGLHIYHYADYETVVLRRLTQRHGVGLDDVDEWIAEGLFVDLLPVVRASILLSEEGYGLKRIEPLYLDPAERGGGVTTAASSVAQYHRLAELRASGDHAGADTLLEDLAAYNRTDCLSTYRLRNWLLAQVTT